MTSRAEQIASRRLRDLLAQLLPGASIPTSGDFDEFQSALQWFIPSILLEVYPWWRYESLDAFRFAVARKVGSEEAEFIGLGLLISDQAWTPLHFRLRASRRVDEIESLECRLGEAGDGNGGMSRTPFGSPGETKLLFSVPERLASINSAYAITRGRFEDGGQRWFPTSPAAVESQG